MSATLMNHLQETLSARMYRLSRYNDTDEVLDVV